MIEEVKSLIDFVQTAGFVGLLVVLAIPRLRGLFGFNGNGNKETVAEMRNLVAPLLSQMELLSSHYNHDLTERDERVINKLEEIHDCLKRQGGKLDNLHFFVTEGGVKIRKE